MNSGSQIAKGKKSPGGDILVPYTEYIDQKEVTGSSNGWINNTPVVRRKSVKKSASKSFVANSASPDRKRNGSPKPQKQPKTTVVKNINQSIDKIEMSQEEIVNVNLMEGIQQLNRQYSANFSLDQPNLMEQLLQLEQQQNSSNKNQPELGKQIGAMTFEPHKPPFQDVEENKNIIESQSLIMPDQQPMMQNKNPFEVQEQPVQLLQQSQSEQFFMSNQLDQQQRSSFDLNQYFISNASGPDQAQQYQSQPKQNTSKEDRRASEKKLKKPHKIRTASTGLDVPCDCPLCKPPNSAVPTIFKKAAKFSKPQPQSPEKRPSTKVVQKDAWYSVQRTAVTVETLQLDIINLKQRLQQTEKQKDTFETKYNTQLKKNDELKLENQKQNRVNTKLMDLIQYCEKRHEFMEWLPQMDKEDVKGSGNRRPRAIRSKLKRAGSEGSEIDMFEESIPDSHKCPAKQQQNPDDSFTKDLLINAQQQLYADNEFHQNKINELTEKLEKALLDYAQIKEEYNNKIAELNSAHSLELLSQSQVSKRQIVEQSDNLNAKITRLEAELLSTRTLLSEAHATCEQFQIQINSYKTDISNYETKIIQLQNNGEGQLQKYIDQNKELLELLEIEKTKLPENAQADFELKIQELKKEHQGQVDQHLQNYNILVQENTTLKQQLSELEVKLNHEHTLQIQKITNQFEFKIQELQNDHQKLQYEHNLYVTNLTSHHQTTVNELQKGHDESKNDHLEQIRKLKANFEHNQQKMQELEKNMREQHDLQIQRINLAHQKQIDEINSQLEKSNFGQSDLVKKLKLEYEGKIEDIKQLHKSEIDTLQLEIEQIKAKLRQEHQAQIDLLTHQHNQTLTQLKNEHNDQEEARKNEQVLYIESITNQHKLELQNAQSQMGMSQQEQEELEAKLKQKHQIEISQISTQHQTAIQDLQNQHRDYIQEIENQHRNQIEEMQYKNQNGIQELQNQHNLKIEEIQNQHKTEMAGVLADQLKLKEGQDSGLTSLKEEHNTYITNITNTHNQAMLELQEAFDKNRNANLQSVGKLREEHALYVKSITNQHETDVNKLKQRLEVVIAENLKADSNRKNEHNLKLECLQGEHQTELVLLKNQFENTKLQLQESEAKLKQEHALQLQQLQNQHQDELETIKSDLNQTKSEFNKTQQLHGDVSKSVEQLQKEVTDKDTMIHTLTISVTDLHQKLETQAHTSQDQYMQMKKDLIQKNLSQIMFIEEGLQREHKDAIDKLNASYLKQIAELQGKLTQMTKDRKMFEKTGKYPPMPVIKENDLGQDSDEIKKLKQSHQEKIDQMEKNKVLEVQTAIEQSNSEVLKENIDLKSKHQETLIKLGDLQQKQALQEQAHKKQIEDLKKKHQSEIKKQQSGKDKNLGFGVGQGRESSPQQSQQSSLPQQDPRLLALQADLKKRHAELSQLRKAQSKQQEENDQLKKTVNMDQKELMDKYAQDLQIHKEEQKKQHDKELAARDMIIAKMDEERTTQVESINKLSSEVTKFKLLKTASNMK